MGIPNESVFARVVSTSRTALAAATFTALMAGSSLTAQLQTQAHYPLLTDLLDATTTYGPMTLYGNGVPAPALPNNGVCVNGVYASTVGGQDVLTPDIASLDTNDFQVDVEFNLAMLPPANRPILMASKWYRWMGIYVQANGTLGLIYNNSLYSWSTTTIAPSTWYSASLQFDNGLAALSINGTLIHAVATGPLNTGNYRDFTTNNWSNGTNFNGCIRNLRISNDTTIHAARWTAYGAGCVAGGAPGFYEQFTASSFDLSNTGVQLQAASPSYVMIQGANAIVQPVSAAQVMANNQTTAVALPWVFPYQGNRSTNTLYVCSNGWVGLETTTTTDASETVAELLSGPARVFAMWDDLNPAIGGTVHWEQDPADPTRFHVTFLGVFEAGTSNPNTFQFTFHQSGAMEIKWGNCTITDCLVGFALGNNQADPGPTDVSAMTVAPLGDGVKALALNSLGADRPVLGTTFDMQVSEIPAGAPLGAMIYSWTQRNPGTDLTSIGMAGCFQHLDIDASFIFVPSGTTFNAQFAVPNVPMLVGWHIYTQAVVLGSTATSLGALSSNGGDMLIDVN